MPTLINNLQEFKIFIESKGIAESEIWFAIDISIGSEKPKATTDSSIENEFNRLFRTPLQGA